MGAQWVWVVRLLGWYLLIPTRVSKGSVLVRQGRLATTAAALAWTMVWLLASYMLVLNILEEDITSCFYDVITDTMSVYNAKVVVTAATVSAYFTNIFCLTRMYWRDLVGIITRNVNLYGKAVGTLKDQPFALSTSLKAFISFIFLSPFVVVNLIAVLCDSKNSLSWVEVMFSSLIACSALPSTCVATVFFVLLHTVEESFVLINKQLLALYASRTPRQFLESSPSPAASRTSLTAHALHTLRAVHFELVEFAEHVMKQFQIEILVFFLTSFIQNVMFTYSVVFNHRNMFHDKKTFYFVCHSLYSILNLVCSLWLTCAGPTRIKAKQGDLMNSTAKLSTILNLPPDIVHEIRIFQLQVRNHTPSFALFGMFELSFSLLFSMCTSIVSYIVVLLQFATPSSDTAITITATHSVTATSTVYPM